MTPQHCRFQSCLIPFAERRDRRQRHWYLPGGDRLALHSRKRRFILRLLAREEPATLEALSRQPVVMQAAAGFRLAVDEKRPGDRGFIPAGAFAEPACVPAGACACLSENVEPAEGAALEGEGLSHGLASLLQMGRSLHSDCFSPLAHRHSIPARDAGVLVVLLIARMTDQDRCS